jgi:hypothetical protein
MCPVVAKPKVYFPPFDVNGFVVTFIQYGLRDFLIPKIWFHDTHIFSYLIDYLVGGWLVGVPL